MDSEERLRALGERGDIIKAMHRALERDGLARARSVADYQLHRDKPQVRIVGQVRDKQLAGDELGDRMGLTIDGVDGRVHYVEAPASRVEDIGRGSVVAIEPPPSTPRAADRNILAATDANGVYSPAAHRDQARGRLGAENADAYVRSHVRRLEALRRARIVERVHAEHWTIPADLPERGLAQDRKLHGPGPRIDEVAHLSLNQQVSHDGATWLDRTMLGQDRQTLAQGGFGRDVQTAWDRRREVLAERGYITPEAGGGYRGPRDLIQRLEASEVDRVGRKFAAERGLAWRPSGTGEYVSGKLVGQAQLASGRFAMIDNGMRFQLVPWSDPLKKRLGQQISGVAMPGGGIDWSFGRQRGLGI